MRSWRSRPVRNLRFGGNTITAPGGEIDDVAVWNRLLSYAEVAELYRSPVSLGERCKLR